MKSGSTGSTDASGSDASRHSVHRNNESGFTLLETIVAMTVLAIALIAIMQAFSSSAKSAQATDQYVQALVLSQSLMAETLADNRFKLKTRSGRYGLLNWKINVTPTSRDWNRLANDAPWQLFDIAVTVTWPPERQIRLRTLKLGPRNG